MAAASNITLDAHEKDLESGGSQEHIVTEANIGRPLRGGHRPVSVMLSPDQYKAFERLYLTPGEAATVNTSRPALGNPTALGVASLNMTLMPLAINWIGWGPNTVAGAITLVPSLYFTSGLGLILAAIGEFLLGNSFIMLVFATLGGLTLSLGANNDPVWGIAAAANTISPALQGEAAAAAAQAAGASYAAGMGIWLVSWAVLCALYTFMATKIHVVFFTVFLNITCMLASIGASYYAAADGHAIASSRLIVAGGCFAFVAVMFTWYMLTGLILLSVGAPSLPMGDLSSGLPWKKARKAE